MTINDITLSQLKRATFIKEEIDRLNKQLAAILGGPASSGAAPKKTRAMSASAKRKIAAAQKARWANMRRAASRPAKPAATAKKKIFSRGTRAKLSAKLKAYWAAKKAGKK
jgi:hypothetical protein